MLAQADLQVAAAAAQVKTNNNIENQVALTEALANKEGVLAAVEGFRSEQIVNRIALKKEEIELNNSISDAEKERRIAQLEFDESQEQTELGKLEKQRERLEEENEIIAEDLERKRELYAEGTQARVDAEIEFANRKQEIDNQLLENTRATSSGQKKIDDKEAADRVLLAEQVKNAKVGIAQNTLSLIGSIAEEGSALAKGVAVAQATISGYQGVQNAFTSAAASPITSAFPAYPFIQAGLAGAFSAVQIGKILSTKKTETSAPSGGGGGRPSTPAAPSFNLVQGSATNQIANSVNAGTQPVRSFVVSSDITSNQELDRRIEEGSTL